MLSLMLLTHANAVAAEVTGSNGAGDLDEANSVVVSGGDVDAAEAAAIQSISGYDGSASDYDITDTAAALISAGDDVLDVDGVDTVSVTGGPVDADTGALLNDMVADVEFDVSDARGEVVENTASLDEANSVVVTGTAAADALNNAEYQALLSEMTGDGSNITGHIDLVSVKPVISSFIVDTGDSLLTI